MLPDFFTLNVDKNCIDKGVPGDAGICAVSLAMKDSVPTEYEVITANGGNITVSKMREDGTKDIFSFENDGMLNMWLDYFDNHLDVWPIEIDVDYNPEDVDTDEDGNTVYEGEAKVVDSWDIINNMEEYEDMLYPSR